jgi:hypothetical protein
VSASNASAGRGNKQRLALSVKRLASDRRMSPLRKRLIIGLPVQPRLPRHRPISPLLPLGLPEMSLTMCLGIPVLEPQKNKSKANFKVCQR